MAGGRWSCANTADTAGSGEAWYRANSCRVDARGPKAAAEAPAMGCMVVSSKRNTDGPREGPREEAPRRAERGPVLPLPKRRLRRRRVPLGLAVGLLETLSRERPERDWRSCSLRSEGLRERRPAVLEEGLQRGVGMVLVGSGLEAPDSVYPVTPACPMSCRSAMRCGDGAGDVLGDALPKCSAAGRRRTRACDLALATELPPMLAVLGDALRRGAVCVAGPWLPLLPLLLPLLAMAVVLPPGPVWVTWSPARYQGPEGVPRCLRLVVVAAVASTARVEGVGVVVDVVAAAPAAACPINERAPVGLGSTVS